MAGAAAWLCADREYPDSAGFLIKERHAAVAIDATIEQLKVSAYRQIWRKCDEEQRLILHVVAQLRPSPDPTHEWWNFLRSKKMLSPDNEVIGDLHGRGIIYYDGNHAPRLVIPGFGAFIRNANRGIP